MPASTKRPHTPLALIILDGWGLRAEREYNAVTLANPTNYYDLLQRYRNSTLQASGEAVGLPEGQMGNSEVGHTNLGAGRVVYQDLTRIDKSIRDGDFFDAAETARSDRSLQGRRARAAPDRPPVGRRRPQPSNASARDHRAGEAARRDARVRPRAHRRTRHGAERRQGLRRRRSKPTLARVGVGKIASVSGRYYAMDRDKRWERVKLGYDAIVRGAGPAATSAMSVIEASYANNVTDEFIIPTVIADAAGKPVGPIADGDSVVFFNFRADRMRQIIRTIAFDDFDGFERPNRPHVECTTMTEYDPTFTFPIVFPNEPATGYIAEVLAANGLTNLRLAETEKYAHVTYFFNGGREAPYEGEDRVLVPSPKVPTYDLKPEMSAEGIADALVRM